MNTSTNRPTNDQRNEDCDARAANSSSPRHPRLRVHWQATLANRWGTSTCDGRAHLQAGDQPTNVYWQRKEACSVEGGRKQEAKACTPCWRVASPAPSRLTASLFYARLYLQQRWRQQLRLRRALSIHDAWRLARRLLLRHQWRNQSRIRPLQNQGPTSSLPAARHNKRIRSSRKLQYSTAHRWLWHQERSYLLHKLYQRSPPNSHSNNCRRPTQHQLHANHGMVTTRRNTSPTTSSTKTSTWTTYGDSTTRMVPSLSSARCSE